VLPDLEAFLRPKRRFLALFPSFFAWDAAPGFSLPPFGDAQSPSRGLLNMQVGVWQTGLGVVKPPKSGELSPTSKPEPYLAFFSIAQNRCASLFHGVMCTSQHMGRNRCHYRGRWL